MQRKVKSPRRPVNRAKVALRAGEVGWCEPSVTDEAAGWRSLFRARPDSLCGGYNLPYDSCHSQPGGSAMRLARSIAGVVVFGSLVVGMVRSQAPAAASEDTGRSIAGGGIT